MIALLLAPLSGDDDFGGLAAETLGELLGSAVCIDVCYDRGMVYPLLARRVLSKFVDTHASAKKVLHFLALKTPQSRESIPDLKN